MKLAKTVSVLACIYLIGAPSVYSADILNLVQNLAGQYIRSWSDLDSRLSDLASQISDARSQGKLTATQAADFNAQLKQIQDEEAQGKASGNRLGIAQSIQFAQELNSLSGSLDQAMTQTVSSLPDVDTLRTQLQTQVDNAVNAGQLNTQAAASLKAELQSEADIEAAYKSETGGNLTARQIEILAERLSKVKTDIDQQTKISQSGVPALDERRAAIQTRIQADLTAGKITAAQASQFETDLGKIATEQKNYQTAGGGMLNGTQVFRIAQELDAVNDKEAAMVAAAGSTTATTAVPTSTSTADLDAVLQVLTNRLNDLANSGTLSATDVGKDTRELDHISWLESSYKAGTGITGTQVQQLLKQANDLKAALDTQVRLAASGQTVATQPSALYPPIAPPANVVVNQSNGTVIGDLPILSNKTFADVQGYWAQPYIEQLASRGVIGGFPNGSFGPDRPITRAQFAAIVAHALHLDTTASGSTFRDVPDNYWASAAINAASKAGLITGYPDGSFHPEDKITRAQALVILSKALHGAPGNAGALNAYSDASNVPLWARNSIIQAASAGIIVNFPNAGLIRANDTATRGEVAALMYQTLSALGAKLPAVRIGLLQ